jgi:hypothetical protein
MGDRRSRRALVSEGRGKSCSIDRISLADETAAQDLPFKLSSLLVSCVFLALMAHILSRCTSQTLLQQSVDSLKIEYVVSTGRPFQHAAARCSVWLKACGSCSLPLVWHETQGNEALVTLPYEFMKEPRSFRFAMREPRAQPAVAVIPYYERCVLR